MDLNSVRLLGLGLGLGLGAPPPPPRSGGGRCRPHKAPLPAQSVAFSDTMKCIVANANATAGDSGPRSTVTAQAASAASQTSSVVGGAKEKDLVFVAGSTGRVGSRTVRELIKLGYPVRAGVRSPQSASSLSLVQSVQQMKLDGPTAASPAEKLEIVECDLEKPGDHIASAIGNAAVVVCSIGASEKQVFDVTGPYRIDYLATKNLIEAATTAQVEHFILVTSLGTNKIGFPAFLLNLFWGVLCWKRQAEEALIASGLPYTIVRPGGMERPTDDFKETHNLVVAREDTYVGGLVSNLQVAELIACMVKNRKASYCKVVEAIAETSAALVPMEEQLSKIPSKREPPAELDDMDPKPSTPPAAAAAKPLSPYTAFVDLKPPSSPSPSKPSIRAPAASALDSNGPPSASASEQEQLSSTTPQQQAAPKQQRPLSPYPNYQDLKPPSSPSPSVPKF